MKPILVLALKDLKLLMRDKFGLFWLLIFPLLMAFFFGAIFSTGSGSRGSMKIAVINEDTSQQSEAFINKLDSSSAVTVIRTTADSARTMVRQGKAVAFIIVKPGFGNLQKMFTGDTATTLVAGIDPSRQAEAGYLKGLVMEAWFSQIQSIFSNPSLGRDFIGKMLDSLKSNNKPSDETELISGFLSQMDTFLYKIEETALDSIPDSTAKNGNNNAGLMSGPKIALEDIFQNQNGPKSSWEITFPQAILWALIGCTAAFAIAIVTERTRGTLIRLRMAPISQAHILAGKGAACFIAAISVCCLLIVIAKLLFDIRTPNITNLVMAIIATGICFTGLMMLISVLGKTEQAVAGAGWAILLVFSMLGGGMVPLLAMPKWMITLSNFSPVKWGIYALEGAIWRNLGSTEMFTAVGILIGVGVVSYTIGVIIFMKSK